MSPLNVHVRGLRQRPSDQPSRAICDPSTPSRLGRGRPPPAAPLTSPPRATRSFAVIWLSSERSGRLYAYHSAALACAWRACGRISQSSRHLMLVPKPRNRKWRLILRTCCPPPAAALRAAYARCARVFSLLFSLFHSVILPKKCLFSSMLGNKARRTVPCGIGPIKCSSAQGGHGISLSGPQTSRTPPPSRQPWRKGSAIGA